MSGAPWIVFFPGTAADAPVYTTEDAARAMVDRANQETAGNVEATTMPLHLAVAAPRLLAALKLAYARLNDKAAREEIGALLSDLGEAS